ncbi:hypothetical protein BKA01_005316 [Pseudonocardia eucalypti]|uniref:hypothetical protein n=1 Tax=Pseudonocardia eucalypti TaxID=648755 RepID=UPI0018222768|nr:hypothetical protein [Pseudonocardia eucalypti]
MTIVALVCPAWRDRHGALPEALAGTPAHDLPARPGRTDLAPLLADPAPDRVVLAGTDADLNALVLRLLRTERLATTEVAYLPAHADSRVADIWSLPTAPATAAKLAAHGEPDPVPLVRDDAGGVLVGRGEIRPISGVVYCDDQVVLRGQAGRLEVTPVAPHGVLVGVRRSGLFGRRVRPVPGRAVQIGCTPATVTIDGEPHPRPVTRWTWYRHTEPLRLVRGLA